MAKRHFLQQSHTYKAGKHKLANKLLSEKLDGQRAFWDGGLTRDIPKADVPWANNEKDDRYVTPPIATGLWSRYGNVVHAPEWFLDMLPFGTPLDGELWCGRGLHQLTRSIVSTLVPDAEKWRKVKFIIFDSPMLSDIIYPSIIDLINFHKFITPEMVTWTKERCKFLNMEFKPFVGINPYSLVYSNLQEFTFIWNNNLQLIDQERLPSDEAAAQERYEAALSEVLFLGGEGLVTRNSDGNYIPERVHHCVKHKPYYDSEAEVIGYITGSETDKGSKLLGLLGALIVRWKGKVFKLSGLTNEERTLYSTKPEHKFKSNADSRIEAFEWAYNHPEYECPNWIEAVHFPIGTKVTFKYRELTDAGIPKEAAYLRKKGKE